MWKKFFSVKNVAIFVVLVTGLFLFYREPLSAKRHIIYFEDLEPDSVIEVQPKYSYTPFYLYYQDEQNVETYLRVDPNTGCWVNWIPTEGYFEEACNKIRYDLSGQPLDNGSLYSLKRYEYMILVDETDKPLGIYVFLNRIVSDATP